LQVPTAITQSWLLWESEFDFVGAASTVAQQVLVASPAGGRPSGGLFSPGGNDTAGVGAGLPIERAVGSLGKQRSARQKRVRDGAPLKPRSNLVQVRLNKVQCDKLPQGWLVGTKSDAKGSKKVYVGPDGSVYSSLHLARTAATGVMAGVAA
jgi:hypothetical protein